MGNRTVPQHEPAAFELEVMLGAMNHVRILFVNFDNLDSPRAN